MPSGGDSFKMKRFVEDDFQIDKDSPINFIKSILIMILLAPAKFFLTVTTKIVYLPKAAIEVTLLYALVISAIITCLDALSRLYLGTFALGNAFFLSCVICTVILIVLYLFFSTYDIKLYSQMASLICRAVPQEEDVSEDEIPIQDDLTEEVKQPQVEVESVKNEESSETDVPKKVLKSLTADSIQNIELPDLESLDDIFEEKSAVDVSRVNNQSKKVNIIESSEVLDFQNRLRNKVNSLSDLGSTVGEQLDAQEMTALLAEMDESTDPSQFLDEEFLQSFEEVEIGDDLNIEALQLGVIPNSFKILC